MEEMKNNIHLIVGEDDFLVESAAKKIIETSVPEELRTSAVEIIAGASDNAEGQLDSIAQCKSSVMTPPFLDPVKLTWWRGVSFLPGGGRGGKIADDVKKALESFADTITSSPLPKDQILIISATKLLKTSTFAKTIFKGAEFIEFVTEGKWEKDKAAAALMRLPEMAKQEGVSFEAGADVEFIAKVGHDTRTIFSELQKLRDFLGKEKRAVTLADIAEITSVSSSEPELWEMIGAICSRNPQQVLKLYSRFEQGNGFAIRLLNTLEKSFREMIVARDAIDNKWLSLGGVWSKKIPPEQIEALDATGVGPNTLKTAWAARKIVQNANAFSLTELRQARFRLLRLRERVVSGGSEELIISELLRISKRRT
jgi:DNA polymerase-3 subunit delta